jgi:hypothetical protein
VELEVVALVNVNAPAVIVLEFKSYIRDEVTFKSLNPPGDNANVRYRKFCILGSVADDTKI